MPKNSGPCAQVHLINCLDRSSAISRSCSLFVQKTTAIV